MQKQGKRGAEDEALSGRRIVRLSPSAKTNPPMVGPQNSAKEDLRYLHHRRGAENAREFLVSVQLIQLTEMIRHCSVSE
jgi:hypothetical protein